MNDLDMEESGALLDSAAHILHQRLGTPERAALAIVSGSGLGLLARLGREVAAIPFAEIPGLGGAGVAGHAGRWSLLEVEGQWVHCLAGRRHYYEGVGTAATGFAMRLLARLGAARVILTNAAGGVNARLRVGDLMLIRDHLNLMGCNPLASGEAGRLMEARRADFAEPYDAAMNCQLLEAALAERIELREGVYTGLRGPCYETPAEVRLVQRLGGDAVGMSTVPEVLTARAVGLRVAAISVITNSHIHRSAPPSHEEVLAMARQSGEDLLRLLGGFISRESRAARATL